MRLSLCAMLLVGACTVAIACVPVDDVTDAGPNLPSAPALYVEEGAPPYDTEDVPARVHPALPADLAEHVTLLEDISVAMPDGRSPEVLLELPADAESVVLLASAHMGVHVILERAVGPRGDVLVNDVTEGVGEDEAALARGFPAQFFSANRVVPGRELAAFLVPSSPDVPFDAGSYRLRFTTWDVARVDGEVTKTPVARPLRVSALVKRKAERNRGRVSLDLTFHLTGAADITAANALENEGLQTSIGVLREALAGIAVDVRAVSYVDVMDPGFRTVVLADGCEGGDLDDLMKLSAEGGEGVHLFLVERFQCLVNGGVDVGQGIGGLTAGLPGPPWVRGSLRSGVAVATGPFGGDAQRLGVVLAHELGHFLGLYHTKENDLFGGPEVYDAISDTPEDDRASDNLMYFLAADSTWLSDGQASVVRASPWTRP